MFDPNAFQAPDPVIRIIGVGTAGGKALGHLCAQGISGVDYVCVDCDEQALNYQSSFARVVHLCKAVPISRGLGESLGRSRCRQLAFDCRDQLERLIAGTDLLFIAWVVAPARAPHRCLRKLPESRRF